MFRDFLINITYRLSKWIGRQRLPFSRKLLTSADYYQALMLLREGDTILGTRYGELSNAFIPGKWKHAAIFIGGSIPSVMEADGSGVHRASLLDFILSRDDITILRPAFSFSAEEAVRFALSLEGASYDYEFKAGNDAFYCSELVAVCYRKASPMSPLAVSGHFGVITPTDLAESGCFTREL